MNTQEKVHELPQQGNTTESGRPGSSDSFDVTRTGFFVHESVKTWVPAWVTDPRCVGMDPSDMLEFQVDPIYGPTVAQLDMIYAKYVD